MSKGKQRQNTKYKHKINDQIRGHEVMLVGPNVEKGTYTLKEAKRVAEEAELDLVLMNPNSKPPVCKLMNYSKFLFDQSKKDTKPKSKPLKTVRFRPNTGSKDLEVKMNQILKFLDKGHKVKAYVFFKGRENRFKDDGKKLLLQMSEKITEEGKGIPENLPKMEGYNKMSMIFKPNKK
jgi:translation initiation factor IF-3